jgi:hypothetical protein
VKFVDGTVQGMYDRDMEQELTPWERDLLATWTAEQATKPSTSFTFITTPPKRAFSPTVAGELSERHGPVTEIAGIVALPRQPKKLMLAGDWHGNLPWAFKAINFAKANGADAILHVGDFGWWKAGEKTWQFLAEVNNEVKAAGITLYWVDGNHEDHSFWHTFNRPGAAPMATKAYPHIVHLPRGYRWNWWGDTWMALGGAHSVDRSFAIEGESWWPGEWLDDDQLEYAMRNGKVDIIVAHDAPTNVDIPGITPGKDIWLRFGDGKPRRVPDVDLLKAEEHRARIQLVCDAVKPVEFYHGHYHRDYNALCRVEGGGYVNVRGLDKDETTMAKNTYFITEGLDD